MFSVRIVNSDFYVAAPIPDLDVCNSAFRETATDKVPVIRIYGATPSGQKTCMHVHGVFPYIYVPFDGTQPTEKYVKQFAISVDFAVQVSLGKASSSRQHVYEISVVKGIPFYGYHEGEREFLKISFYNPSLVTRVVSLLQNGAVMNKVFQPHEAHIPYLLQFFMDYNLYGMNLLHASTVKFRNPVRLLNGEAGKLTSPCTATQKSKSPQLSLKAVAGSPHELWNEDTVPRECILGSDVERLSFCELEVDVIASDILNRLEIGVNIGTNPGLAAIWEDEQQRRRDANESSQISAPSTQDRGLIQETETEKQFKERIKEIIDERDLLIQSQMGKLGREASPEELASFQDSICSLTASQREGIAKEALDADTVSQLLSQHVQGMLGEGSGAEASQVVIDEDEPVVNQSIVQEVVEASQASFSQELSSSMDKEMIDILASLAEEPNEAGSQRAALSQNIVLDQGDAPCDEEAKEEELSESEESILMSQKVWDDIEIEHRSVGSGDEQMVTDEQGSHVGSQRASQYNLEGMSDSWIGSFLAGDIPQFDGAADEHSDGPGDIKIPRRKPGKGRVRKRSSQFEGTSKTTDDSTQRAISLTKLGNAEHAKTKTTSKCSRVEGKSEESLSEDTWPTKGRAIRTYSKKSLFAQRMNKSSTLNEGNAEKDDGEAIVVMADTRGEGEGEEEAFRLVLSESSDSEGSNFGGVNLDSAEGSEIMVRKKNPRTFEGIDTKTTEVSSARKDGNTREDNLGSKGRQTDLRAEGLGLKKSSNANAPTTRKDKNPKVNLASGKRGDETGQEDLRSGVDKNAKGRTSTAHKEQDAPESCTPVITKYFHSPEKDRERIKTRVNRTKQSFSSWEQLSKLHKTDDALTTTPTLPQCSTQQWRNLRKSTLRKRKLSEVDKKERELSKETMTRRIKRSSDFAVSLSAVSGAMANFKISLEDVSQIPALNSKYGQAETRLKNRREEPSHGFTRVLDQRLSSAVRKQNCSQRHSPTRSKKNESSPLSKKRTSPKKKEERLKKYGTLPVLISKSPIKNSVDNSQLSETSLASQRRENNSTVRTSKISSSGAGISGTGYASSRSRTRGRESSNRLKGQSSSETTSSACAFSSKGPTSKETGPFPSLVLSLKSDSGDKDKSRNDSGRTFSVQKRGLKRKLVMDVERVLGMTPVGVLPGTGKKRKLSLKLQANSSRTFPRKESIAKTPVILGEEGRLVEVDKPVKLVKEAARKPLHSQQTEVDIDNNDGRLCFDDKKDFVLSKDITCIPSSPVEPEASDESSSNVTESNSLTLSTKSSHTFSQAEDSSEVSLPKESGHKTTDNVACDSNYMQLLSEEQDFPEEKDTELLANALFNMSFPSPIPYGEECCSPPHPSTPQETNSDARNLIDEHDSLDKNEVSTVGSSVVEEDNTSVVVEIQRSSTASFQTQAQQTAYFSSANTDVPEGSSLLPFCPQLGETQTQFESRSVEIDNCTGQKICEKEITCDKGSFDSRAIPNSRTSDEVLLSEGKVKEENKDISSNTEFANYEEQSCEIKTVREYEANKSFTDVIGLESVRMKSRDAIDLTPSCEAGELSSSSKENQQLVLMLSTEEESLTNAVSSIHSNQHVIEMEISLEEDNDNRPQDVSTEGMHSGISDVLANEAVGQGKSQTSGTHDTLSRPNFTSSNLGISGVVAITPLKKPPTSDELMSSLKDYGLPQCKYQEPFCSDPDDIPACPREVGGRILRIGSKEVSHLPEFESSSSSQGLKHWRMVMSSARECGIQSVCQAMDDASTLHKNVELKIALMGDGDVVVTPCRGPPAPEVVKAWARDKLTKRYSKGQKRGGDLAPKMLEMKEPSKNENWKGDKQDRDSEKKTTDANVAKSSGAELEQGIPVTSGLERPSKGVAQRPNASSLDSSVEVHVDSKQNALDNVEGEKKPEVMELSDSSVSPVELTSPRSLFSPNETKMFSFASGKQTEVARTNHDKAEILGTQPMYAEWRDARTERKEVVVTSGANSVTVTPCKLRSPEQTPSTTKHSLSPLQQTHSPVFPAPYHSTPVATKLVYGAQSPRCTPISDAATKPKRLDTNVEVTGNKTAGAQASSDQAHSLRQQLLASQFKFVTPGAQPRRSMSWTSQIEGPSPSNTYGFKVTQVNLQNAKALHEVQHLTLFSLELHVRTRRDVRPDPEFDPICAIFYYIQTDTPLPDGNNKVTGIICVDSESAKITTSATENKENSLSNRENSTRQSPNKDAVASTSTSNVTMSNTSQNSQVSHLRPLLCRAGITDYDVLYVAEEKDLFAALLDIIHKWDPDILIGYEVQMFSWGFLLERALTFEIDLCSRLARVKGSSSSSNMDAEKDRWGAAHTSEIKIAGRIILNVWRLMRHEVALNSYSFENIAFHVLHERIPLFTFRTLSDWWDHRTSLNRWRTVDHYVTRCRGNVRILESVDFIGRTSELARLFGILFFSVISRGTQYRVESMMLRIAKPMNYIPVSPSVEQRVAMRAPETIPLVMEPESRFYSDPVLVLDFQSLYPSMVIAYNYCFSTCLGRVSCLSEYGEFKFGATSLCVPPSLLKKLEGDIHISPNGVAFVKPSVRKGILPSMLDDILQTRIMVKTSMKRWKTDKSLGRMLDARQLGLKLIANVTFGYTSAHYSGRMPCVEIGDSIVRKARETLEQAIDLVNNTPRWGARVVYGDTDSLFVLLKGVTKEQAFSIGKDIVDTVTAMNPKPVKLKFEKVYLPCVLQTKKRYVGYMYETLDQKEPVFDAKGIETVRRDSCPAVAKILEKSLRILFEARDLSLVKKYVQRQCTKLMEGQASLQDFTFAKEYRGMKNYKPGACVPALELTRRMLREDRRSEPRVGERVPYVVVYGSPGLPLIQLVRRPHEVLQDPGLRLNASYYITKQILPPLNRAFALIGLDVFTWYAELPRIVRVAQMPTNTGNKKKGTISQYFSTMTCPVCQELTPTDLCTNCRARPQVSAVTLMNRMRGWERTHQHLAEICFGCCGSRDRKLCCVSLDCPVFYKLVQCTRDIKSSQHLTTILESL